MREPSTYEKFHWKLFNASAKMFGFCLSLVSLIAIALTIASISGAIIGEGKYPVYLLPLLMILLILGILLLRAKPYYPKKYREWFEKRKENRKKQA